jgi:hypothetical protein
LGVATHSRPSHVVAGVYSEGAEVPVDVELARTELRIEMRSLQARQTLVDSGVRADSRVIEVIDDQAEGLQAIVQKVELVVGRYPGER